MEDATGQRIYWFDLLMFKTAGAHGDRGVAFQVLPGAETLVALCADGTKVVVKGCDVTVVDRTFFYPGVPVTSASDPDGQSGIVTACATELDLLPQLIFSGDHKARAAAAAGVSPLLSQLRRAGELVPGDYVVHRGHEWVGRVVQVSLDVDVLYDDGAICRVTSAAGKLRTLDYNELAKGAFFPGQRVAADDDDVFKASRWIRGYWKPSRGKEEGTVARSKVSGILVYWLASSSDSEPPPAYHHDSRNLTFFCPDSVFNFWLVGNRCSYFHEPSVVQEPLIRNRRKRRATRGLGRRRGSSHDHRLSRSDDEPSWVVTNTHTTVDVLWQDGTRQHGVPSASLQPFVVWNRHERVPGQWVVMSSAPAATDVESPSFGIVRSFNHKDMTARVSWFFKAAEEEEPRQVGSDQTLSAYSLGLAPDHDFIYGDMVIRLLRPTATDPTREEQQRKNNKEQEEDLSWVGRITDLFCDAPYITVKWGDGNTSKVRISLFKWALCSLFQSKRIWRWVYIH